MDNASSDASKNRRLTCPDRRLHSHAAVGGRPNHRLSENRPGTREDELLRISRFCAAVRACGSEREGNRAHHNGDWLKRAVAAKAGIYGNDAAEATYPLTRVDSDGQTLDGSKHNYTLTFPPGQLPPVHAFWSLTMYDGKTQLLIENPINRYLINAPMLPAMKTNADGSLTSTSSTSRQALTGKPTGCQLQTAQSIWSCGSTGRRPRHLRSCRWVKGYGSHLVLKGTHRTIRRGRRWAIASATPAASCCGMPVTGATRSRFQASGPLSHTSAAMGWGPGEKRGSS